MSNDQPEKQPQSKDKIDPAKNDTSETSVKESKSDKSIFGVDYYLISTVSLAVISLCALFVSIYQTNVLSGQQEVMDEQQKIMRSQQELMQENARAQLWPRLRLNMMSGYQESKIHELSFTLVNEGTGPAIIEHVAIGYNGIYEAYWSNLWQAAGIVDSIGMPTISNEQISNRVVQAGEEIVFLSLNSDSDFMNLMLSATQKDKGLEMILCYRSVFNQHWMVEVNFGDLSKSTPTLVDSCIVGEKPAFTM